MYRRLGAVLLLGGMCLLVSPLEALSAKEAQQAEEVDRSDGLAWGIGTAESLLWGTLGLLIYTDVSYEWVEPLTYMGVAAASLGGAGVGAAAYINRWPGWIGRGIHGLGTGLGEALVLTAMSQKGGDEIWGEITPEVWGMASAFGVATATASALGIDSYQEFLTVAAFQGAGLVLGALGGAGYKLFAVSACSGSDCPTENEGTTVFMTSMFAGMMVGHVTGLVLMSIKGPEQAAPTPDPETLSIWQRIRIVPTVPLPDSVGVTATLAW